MSIILNIVREIKSGINDIEMQMKTAKELHKKDLTMMACRELLKALEHVEYLTKKTSTVPLKDRDNSFMYKKSIEDLSRVTNELGAIWSDIGKTCGFGYY